MLVAGATGPPVTKRPGNADRVVESAGSDPGNVTPDRRSGR
jgi:hypothetical protein